jgi:hypothetical protein
MGTPFMLSKGIAARLQFAHAIYKNNRFSSLSERHKNYILKGEDQLKDIQRRGRALVAMEYYGL